MFFTVGLINGKKSSLGCDYLQGFFRHSETNRWTTVRFNQVCSVTYMLHDKRVCPGAGKALDSRFQASASFLRTSQPHHPCTYCSIPSVLTCLDVYIRRPASLASRAQVMRGQCAATCSHAQASFLDQALLSATGCLCVCSYVTAQKHENKSNSHNIANTNYQ